VPRARGGPRRVLRRRRYRRVSRVGAKRRLAAAYAGISQSAGAQPKAFGRRGRWAAVGIGTTLLFHCDHVVASADATFTTPFLKLALIPEAASSLLAPMRMGYARAFEMLVMGHSLSAEQAREAGIVNKVVDAAAVDAVALQAAQEIAALPAGAVAVSRRLLRGHLDAVVRQIDTEVMHFKDRLQSDEARADVLPRFCRARSEGGDVACRENPVHHRRLRAASGWRSRCAPRATAPISPSRRKPPSRIQNCKAPSIPRPMRSSAPAAKRCRWWSMCATSLSYD